MRIATTRADLGTELGRLEGRVALVPTMGALHEGHRSLVRRARELAGATIVTIFVNPLQFGPNEDLDRYPRPFEADLKACEEEGVELVFAPPPQEVYRQAPLVRVTAGALAEKLCGATRPGHFDGVLTVVAKLLHLTGPDVAIFGEKDAQQLRLIRRMVDDLDFPVEIVGAPTVREPDGLALSSRNAYLSPDERRTALALIGALRAGAAAADGGPDAVRRAAREVLDAEPGVRPEYLELVDPDTLEPLDRSHEAALLAVAGQVGSTRLIDNVTIAVAGTYSKEP